MINEVQKSIEMDVTNFTKTNNYWASRYDAVDDWPLMKTPYWVLFIITSYLLFVLKLGPAYMKDRQPYKLKNVLLVYNLIQIAISTYIFVHGVREIKNFGIFESETCVTDSEYFLPVLLRGQYLYFLAKFTELLETIFFVLRKKTNQVSFLHVYHHSIMFVGTWTTLKYGTIFSYSILGTFNAFVHMVMYAYYLLATFPSIAKYLWWKKYITKLQLIQFFGVMIHIQINAFVTKCKALSTFVLVWCWAHFFLFVYLFGSFYIKNYKRKNQNNKQIEKNMSDIKEKTQ